MSLRAYTDHIDDYNRTHTLEIHKEGYDGSVDYLKNTQEGYASFDYEKIDPKNPTENPIQKGALEFSVWIHTDDLIDEIKESDEQTFWAVHKVDGTQEWQGYIYNDLSTYEENILPCRITIMAKDFTDLGGKDYLVSGSLPDSRENVIETIAYLLNTVGFDIPIKTHTSWIEENLEDDGSVPSDYDYLNRIYHETKALRTFGRTGDESDQPITVEKALNQLCVSHGLLLKQAGGCYWIDQFSEYEDPENVQEAEYNLSGTQQSLTTGNDLTVDANTSDLRVVIDQNNRDNSGLPGLKRVESRYNHRTNIITQFVPSRLTITDTEPDQFFEQEIGYNGNQEILLRFDVSITHGSGGDSASLTMTLSAGGQTWDSSSEQWLAPGTGDIEIDLTPTSSGFRASVEILTDSVPTDDDNLGITFRKATVDGVTADFTAYTNIFLQVQNPVNIERNSEGIVYQLTQNGRYSVESELDDTWYGDGPELYSPGALRYEDALDSITDDSFQRRGAASYRNFHWNLLAEHLDVRRDWRRLLSALLKGTYYAWQILSYDSEYFYFLGGSWDLWTGNWQGELFALDIQTSGSDTFEDIPKYSDESGSGTSSGGGGSGGGMTESLADAKYFKQGFNLSEGDPLTLQANIGLKDQSADLDLNSVSINGTNLVQNGSPQGVGTEDEPTWPNVIYGDNDTGTLDGRIDLNTISKSGFYYAGGGSSNDFGNNGVLLHMNYDGGGGFAGQLGIPVTGDNRMYVRRQSSGSWNEWDQIASDGMTEGFTFAGTLDVGDTLTGVDASFSGPLNMSASSPIQDAGNNAIEFDGSGNVTFPGSVTVVGTPTNIRSENLVVEDPLSTFADGNTTDGVDIGWVGIRSSNNIGVIWDESADEIATILTTDDGRTEGNVSITDYADFHAGAGVFSSTLDVGGVATFEDDITADNFSTGFQGDEWQITNAGVAEFEDVLIRGGLTAYEAIINRVRYNFGNTILSAGGGKVASVSGSAPTETITFEDPEGNSILPVADGDLLLLQNWDQDRTTIIKRIWRRVDSISGSDVTLAEDGDMPSDTGSIVEGDELVVNGNDGTTSGRDSLIAQSITDTDKPYIRLQDGINSYSDWSSDGTVVAQLGDLSNISDADIDFGLFGRDFDIQSGSDYWRTSDNTGSVGDGILTWDGNAGEVGIAAFTANSNYLAKDIGTNGKIVVGDFGDGFERVGISDTGGFGSAEDHVSLFHNGTNWGILGRSNGGEIFFRLGDENHIAGASFDNEAMWSDSNNKTFGGAGILMDWQNERMSIGDAIQIENGQLFARNGIKGQTTVVNDDSVNPIYQMDVSNDESAFLFISTNFGNTWAIYHVTTTTGSGAGITLVISSDDADWDFSISSGQPTMGSGSDNETTVYIDTDTAIIYIINRVGSTIRYGYQLLANL